jgi:mannosyltransferase OCH1-like enzyme
MSSVANAVLTFEQMSAVIRSRALDDDGVCGGNGSALPEISRRIVQFWDSPKPPRDVAALMATWPAAHRDYEVQAFDDATAASSGSTMRHGIWRRTAPANTRR